MGRWCQKGSRVRSVAQDHPQMGRTRPAYLLSWVWCSRDLLKVISCRTLTSDRFFEAIWRPRLSTSGDGIFFTNYNIRNLVTMENVPLGIREGEVSG